MDRHEGASRGLSDTVLVALITALATILVAGLGLCGVFVQSADADRSDSLEVEEVRVNRITLDARHGHSTLIIEGQAGARVAGKYLVALIRMTDNPRYTLVSPPAVFDPSGHWRIAIEVPAGIQSRISLSVAPVPPESLTPGPASGENVEWPPYPGR